MKKKCGQRFLMVVLSVFPLALPAFSQQTTPIYQEKPVSNPGSISGTISFKGERPKPKIHELSKFPNADFCSRESDGKGNRVVHEVRVGDRGVLQDAIVSIRNITEGKPFDFSGTEILAKDCNFLVQNGPSTRVGIVVKKEEMRVTNQDADPNDPKAVTGVLHNPHTYEVMGAKSTTLFNVPLGEKGQTISKPIKLKREGSFVKLECDQHNFMQSYFLPVTNPYFAIVGESGSYQIDKIPPGQYEVVAWHPILGESSQTISVPGNGTAKADFAFLK